MKFSRCLLTTLILAGLDVEVRTLPILRLVWVTSQDIVVRTHLYREDPVWLCFRESQLLKHPHAHRDIHLHLRRHNHQHDGYAQ